MILTDAGPIIAIIDAADADHDDCVSALDDVQLPLATTWPAFTEAMYLLGANGGYPAQAALWTAVDNGVVEIMHLSDTAIKRSGALMDKYADTPMDLADATLVAAAEQLDTDRVFTIDDDFQIYRTKKNRPFTVIP